MTSVREVPALPTQRWFDAGGASPARLGLAVALGCFALFFVVVLLSGRVAFMRYSEDGPREIRIALVLSLLAGYLPAALAWATRGVRQQVAALRPLLPDAKTLLDELALTAGCLPARSARRAAVIGVLCALPVPLSIDRDPRLFLTAAYWRPEAFYHWTLLLLVAAALARASYAIWRDSRRLSALADRLAGFDLLDLTPLAPFSRHGLRIALLALLLVSIAAILLGDQGFAPVIALSAAAALVFATWALLVPVRGARRRIRDEKQRELTRVRAALHGERRALDGSRIRAWAGVASLADLVAWEARIEAVPEWPFDLPTLSRFGLYLLIPLGSWLGGALVERLLGWLLG